MKSYTDILGEIASTVAQAVASIRRLAVLAWALTQGNGLKELSLLNKNETTEFRTKTEGKNCTDVIYILRVFARKKLFISLKPCRKTGKCFEERLRGGKLFKNWEIFWMNNRTIIELGFRMVWGFMQLRSCYPPTLTTTSAINTPITFPGFSSTFS